MVLPVSFIDKLQVATATFQPLWGQETSGQANGQNIVRDLRSMLWQAQITTGQLTADDALDIQSLILSIGGSLGTFYCFDPRRNGPRFDPAGTTLGASTVKVHTVGVDNHSMRLKGLPAGYKLQSDYLAFDYGAGPSRAFHQMAGGTLVTADGSGVTPSFDVQPPFRPGIATEIVVTLYRPAAEMQMLPGSLSTSIRGKFTTVSFNAIQYI